ncbi:hypothetical protein JX265_007772 [Neoarthrinium moseri]|uniref:Uncharacterized protein n=1 Tax=Neoarthrinium moseri TaxID=1658444 RepID=A0A9P9WJB3_9PEZI|nr:uncharacterized protein JN550_003351 [Neoarthrinium moseri]KAI1843298.1 hypothetical protein JX266_010472 [Neoarthrinium moseri]KAI1866471.1 hypothetical protein JX265_007772 [Neoarthrinium moseri]KAI1873098.1 hypothetical protein JN550_003351 [Neoarthrinium moseri]
MRQEGFSIALAFLLLLTGATATVKSPVTLEGPLEARDVVCSRELGEPIGGSSLAEAASSGSAVVAYTVGGGALMHAVCEGIIILRHGPQDENSRSCSLLSQGVAAAVLIGTTAAAQAKGSTGSTTSDKRMESSLSEMIRQQIGASGATVEGIDTMPLSRRSLSNGVVERLKIKGMRHPEGYISWDHLVTRYQDGNGYVQTTPVIPGSSKNAKRHDGQGFKYNWQRFDVNTNFLGSPDLSVLPQLSAAVSNDWAVRADNDRIDEYIFTGGVDHIYTFGMRIIAETGGFGEEYEDVNVCGDLRGIAHDELKLR